MTNRQRIADYELPFEAILTQVRNTDIQANPNIHRVVSCILREGPRSYRCATVFFIRDSHTGEIHHHELRIENYQRTKSHGWELSEKRSVGLNNDESDEIKALYDFLGSYTLLQNDGDYVVINGKDLQDSRVRSIIKATTEQQQVELLSQMLDVAQTDLSITNAWIEAAWLYPDKSRFLVAALNCGRFSQMLGKLEALVEENALEEKFQTLLKQNSWMFGSEYSKLIDKRAIIADEQMDFLLQRTSDGYLEIIEIKRPKNGERLFNIDSSHRSLYPTSELSMVLGQVMKYLDTLTTNHALALEKLGVPIYRTRAKIIIGRDGDTGQQDALRQLNSQLHNIEIITFDQLIRTAKRVIGVLQTNSEIEE